MFEQLNTVIEKRVKEVLQFHLNGTTEEFDAAASDNTDQESTGISFSYTMGGMTLGGAMNDVDSMDGVATGDYEGYEFNLSFAF